MDWWDALWKWANESQLGATVVGGLIVAAVVGVISLAIAVVPKWREPVLSAIRHGWSVVISIRLTTTRRIEADKAQAHEQGVNDLFKAIAPSGEDITSLKDLLLSPNVAPSLVGPVTPSAPSPTLPPRGPSLARWSARHRNGRYWSLTNVVPGSVAEDVRINCSPRELEFVDMPNVSSMPGGSTKTFQCDVTESGMEEGVTWVITWDDHNGVPHSETIRVMGTQAEAGSKPFTDPSSRLEEVQNPSLRPLAEWRLEYAPSFRLGSDQAWVFRLTNLADDVEPRRVRVTAKDNLVEFPDGAFWNQFEPLGVETFGATSGAGGVRGALRCTVSWIEDGHAYTCDTKPSFKLALA